MKTGVIIFPGSNCDRDVALALNAISGHRPLLIWHNETQIPNLDLIVVPGGFSYGDYLRSGAMAAHSPVMREVVSRAESGTPVLGICNGFQVLTEAALLPGILLPNSSLKFICRDIFLRVENPFSVFTGGYDDGEVISIPIAHNNGNYFAAAETLEEIYDNDQVAFRYCDEAGVVDSHANPNGSMSNIAGIFNQRKNVLGMMPHPERRSDVALGGTDGNTMFKSLASAFT